MDTSGNGLERGVVHHVERLFSQGTVTGLSEEQLLDRFATARDESAFEALVERHGPMVLGVCRQFLRDPNDVDDAFQATFLVLVRKAGSLRQKDLLGNWLYGVACRVALRSRSVGIRRQTRFALAEKVEDLAGDGGSSRSEPVSEVVLRNEERPLVHEEVNRLPGKYRTPIVLCYFEGLTHDQAAARLGCPVGTVKGRLSRARDLLRTRLSRRGVAVSGAGLAAHLAGADLKASVPASLTHSTLNLALAVAEQGGAAATASSAASLPIASLTEGVLHTMAWSQIRSIMIPFLAAAGVLTTGASVVAFQYGGSFGGFSQEPRASRPHQQPVAAGPQTAKTSSAGSAATEDEVQLARQIVDGLEKRSAQGLESLDPESYNTWSLRLLEAEKHARPENSPEAYQGHAQRMGKMLSIAEQRAKAGQQSSFDVTRWKYFAKESERMLGEARNANPSGNAMGNMMRMMMAGRSMVRGGMGGASMVPGSAEPKEPAVAQQPATAEAAPARPPQPASNSQPKPQASAGGADGGGGFGGSSDEPDEQVTRIQIARMSGLVSTLDKNPKNIAVIKKLEEPMTLHFPTETPLEQILKHIKDATRGADGKKLSIYVDPQALQDAEKTLNSPVMIDLEDVPLRFSLRLLLKQLGLAYCVRDGVVMIGTVEGIRQELMEAQAEQFGLNPDKVRGMMGGGMGGMGGMGGGMGGMGGGMGGMGGGMGMM